MKCLILAAGYATRLYPLTENFPKPLLDVGGKPILDWLIDDLEAGGLVDGYVVVSNHKFHEHFAAWARQHRVGAKITVLDDGTSSNETRLGAVKDIEFAVEKAKLDDDVLVMAGDNLLDFSLSEFVSYARVREASCVMCYEEPDEARLHKTGVIERADDGRILSMEEKPAVPKSHWCVPAFYAYTREDMRLLPKAIADGCGIDAPGSFLSWLAARRPVYAWPMPGRRYDIGNLASYAEAREVFGK